MNWSAVYPDIVLLTMACVVAMVDLWVTDPRRTPTYLLTLAAVAVVGAMHLVAFNEGATVYAAQRMVVADPMGHLLAFFATLVVRGGRALQGEARGAPRRAACRRRS